jgi:hypothetical protein
MDSSSLIEALYPFAAAGLAGLGGYLGAYLKKRLDHLALKHDFTQIKAQLSETTSIVEEVKRKVSGEFWLAQERWKLKRDLYMVLLQTLEEAASFLRDLPPAVITPEASPPLRKAMEEKFEHLRADLRKAKASAHLVSDEVAQLLKDLELFTKERLERTPLDDQNYREALREISERFDKCYIDSANISKRDLMLA